MKNVFFIIGILLISTYASSQITPVNMKCLGGSASDYTNCLYPLPNNSFIIAGSSSSNDGDLSSNNGMSDCWFVQFDTSLTILNSISFGENQFDYIRDVHILSDTSFTLLINSNSNTGVFSGGNGGFDAWIRTLYLPSWLSPALPFGGSLNDKANHITPKSSGGYLVCGSSFSSDGHLSGNFGADDFWVLSLSSTYSVIWSKNFGGSATDEALKIFQLSDGNILVFGNTNSNDNMVNDFKGIKDIWVVKLSSMGDTLWTETLGGSGYDELVNVKQIDTDKFAIIGNSNSPDGSFFYVKNNNEKNLNTYVFYHVIDGDGQFVFGGNRLLSNTSVHFNDMTYSCQLDMQVFGRLDSDTSLTTNDDILILSITDGQVVKSDVFGGNNSDAYSYLFAHKINTNDFIIATSTLSPDISNTFHGDNDILLAMLSKYNTSGIDVNDIPLINLFPNPTASMIQVENLSPEKQWVYFIYNISGKTVQNGNIIHNKGINVSSISQGIYIISVSDGLRTFAKRFVIEK